MTNERAYFEMHGIRSASNGPNINMYDQMEQIDAVASFQQDDYAMTEAEAQALRDPSRRNRPTIPVRSLPKRRS
jgi:hypothetical protein